MIYDPLDPFQQAEQFDLRRRQKETARDMFQPYTEPAEEESALSRLFGAGLTGLGYVGESLGKLGRTVRTGLGLVSGDPRAKASNLLSFVPFSDAMGLTAPEDTPTGQQLLETWGISDPNRAKPEGFFENVVDMLPGLGVDIVTDPLSYMTFGSHALTGAGRAAKASNTLAPSLVGRIRSGQQSLVGFGVPGQGLFGYHNATPFAGAKTADALEAVGRGMSQANKAVTSLPAVGRPIAAIENWLGDKWGDVVAKRNQMFDSRAMDIGDKRLQANVIAGSTEREADLIDAVRPIYEAQLDLSRAGVLTGDAANDAAIMKRFRDQVELGYDNLMRPALQSDVNPNIRNAAEVARKQMENWFQGKYMQTGGGTEPMGDVFADYLHRSLNFIDDTNLNPYLNPKNSDIETQVAAFMSRQPYLKNIPGATGFLQEMSVHPKIGGIQELVGHPLVGKDFKGAKSAYRSELTAKTGMDAQKARDLIAAGKLLEPDEFATLMQVVKSGKIDPAAAQMLSGLPFSIQDYTTARHWFNPRKTVEFLATQPRQRVAMEKALYETDAFKSLAESLGQTANVVNNQRALSKTFMDYAKPRLAAAHDAVPLGEAFKQHGMLFDEARRPEFIQSLIGMASPHGVTDFKGLSDMYVPRDLLNASLTKGGRGQASGIFGGILGLSDSVTNLFKTGNAALFPFNTATAVRNFSGGGIKDVFSNLLNRGLFGSIADWWQGAGPKGFGSQILAGEIPQGLSGYTPEVLSEMVAKSARQPLKYATPSLDDFANVWNKALSPEEQQALHGFKVGGGWPMNEALRSGQPVGDPEALSLLQSALSKAPQTPSEMELYRSLQFNSPEEAQSFIRSLGKEYTHPGFASTSLNPDYPSHYFGTGDAAQNVQLKIKLPAGSRAGYLPPLDATHLSHEQEFLLPLNQKFKVLGVTGQKQYGPRSATEILLEAIGGAQEFSTPLPSAPSVRRAGLSSPLNEGILKSLPQLDAADIAELARLKDREAARNLQTFVASGGFPANYARNEIVGANALEGMGKIPGLTPRTLKTDIWDNSLAKMFTGNEKAAHAFPFVYEGGKWRSTVRGAFGADDTTFAPALVGGALNERGDALNRITQAINLADQGYNLQDPIQAAVAVKQIRQLHGENLTGFERDIMSRIIPFYRWQFATNIPHETASLIQNPGGLQGSVIRFANAMRQQQGFLPGYLQGGLASPVGGLVNSTDEQGRPTTTQRYLTQTDIPIEAALGWIDPRGLSETAQRLLGNLNPLIKAPLEAATSRQFYSGRDMADLYSRTGVPGLDQILFNSPLAKATTTISTISDPRKYTDYGLPLLLNLGTGLRLSDVDLGRRKSHAITEAIRDATKGNPLMTNFESIAPRLDRLDQMDDSDIALLRLYATQKKRQRDTANPAGQ